MFKKILMLDFTERALEPEYWLRIDALCEEKALLPRDSEEIANHFDADALAVNFLPVVDRDRIDVMQNLRYIGILATGYGCIDAAHAAAKGIPVCNVPGYSTEGVAEFAIAAVLEQLRELERAKRQARALDYSEGSFKGTELKGKKFGIVGLGSIGSRIAEIASLGFNANTCYWSRTRKPEYENKAIAYCDLPTLIRESDFISLNLALNDDTKGIITRDHINALKPGAVVVNLAPMELVDIGALEDRLKRGDITFIFDHSDELSTERAARLASHKGCVAYPPIAYTTKEAAKNKQEIFVRNLEAFAEGKVQNRVN